MKNLKLKLTMIVTIITILMMNVAVFATTDITTNVEGKTVVVTVKINENIDNAMFDLEYNDEVYDYIKSSIGEYAKPVNGKVRTSITDRDNPVTFTFEYTGEDKTNTSAFTVSNIEFTNQDGNLVEEAPVSKNVEITIEEQEKPVDPTNPVTPENPEKPTEKEEPTVPADSKEPTKQEAPVQPTQGEVSLNDKKPETLPQAGSLTNVYVVGSFVIIMIVGLVVINNKRK